MIARKPHKSHRPKDKHHPITNPLEDLIGYSLNHAARMMMMEFSRRLGELGLGASSASVLLLVNANPGITQSELCLLLGMQRANMTPLMRLLEHRALVRKEPTSSRRQALSITPTGAQLCTRTLGVINEFERDIYATLSATQRKNMLANVKRIGTVFHPANAPAKSELAGKKRTPAKPTGIRRLT